VDSNNTSVAFGRDVVLPAVCANASLHALQVGLGYNRVSMSPPQLEAARRWDGADETSPLLPWLEWWAALPA
jgi:hypothetical protein